MLMARPVSIGVQAAAMIDCPARVPLIIHAKLRKLYVKDPVDLAAVRRGRLIHATFEQAMVAVDEAGLLGNEPAATVALERAITSVLPDLDASTVAAQASSMSATITASVQSQPATAVAHERRVSVLLAPGVQVSVLFSVIFSSPFRPCCEGILLNWLIGLVISWRSSLSIKWSVLGL